MFTVFTLSFLVEVLHLLDSWVSFLHGNLKVLLINILHGNLKVLSINILSFLFFRRLFETKCVSVSDQ